MQVFSDSDPQVLFEVKEPVRAFMIPFWNSEAYSFGKYIRQYGFYPQRLPLNIFTDHSGPSVINKFNHFEVNTAAPIMMFHSPVLVNHWKSLYSKPCYQLYSPFVFFRKKNKITRAESAFGTIAYPAHTIPELDDVSDIEQYIEQLKALPEKYQPISVSLHYHDVNKGLHQVFIKHGIPVYTAGNPHDYMFVERFYAILRNFKYATSNIVGSYLFYAVELGIPFFLFGNAPEYRSNTNSLLAKEALESIQSEDELLREITAKFEKMTIVVSDEQRELVETTLGLQTDVSRFKMAYILYKSFLQLVKGRLEQRIRMALRFRESKHSVSINFSASKRLFGKKLKVDDKAEGKK